MAVYREITCDQAVLTNALTAPNEIARVLRSARERSLPVYIELQRDMTDVPASAIPVLPRWPADPDALAECAQEIIEKIRAAKVTARKLGLPVVSTFMGRGLMEQSPDVFLGTYLGAAGDPVIAKMIEGAGALLLLGVIFSDTNFALSHRRLDSRRTILAFDRAVRIGHHVYTDIPIDDLIEALIARARPNSETQELVKPRFEVYPRDLAADDEPIEPSDVATAINDLFDRHGTPSCWSAMARSR
jgi:indolepyruvate decarboxylase